MRDPKRHACSVVPPLVACTALVCALVVAEERLAGPRPESASPAPLQPPAAIGYPRGDWGTRRVGG